MAVLGYPLVDCPSVLLGEHGGHVQGFLHSKDSASINECVEYLAGALGIHFNKGHGHLVLTRFLHKLEKNDMLYVEYCLLFQNTRSIVELQRVREESMQVLAWSTR
ncbi:hypothetical protein DSO57_1035230 [Entomophthora muscae]|uniref:Uncharacterized protein n=1 Tax=Entomophthora muscae TaxID=34485 RepID=A0ACC2SNR7_9FUNG|nr:hypothetical protein DSO57_1035230 [Entomophthora muscae]